MRKGGFLVRRLESKPHKFEPTQVFLIFLANLSNCLYFFERFSIKKTRGNRMRPLFSSYSNIFSCQIIRRINTIDIFDTKRFTKQFKIQIVLFSFEKVFIVFKKPILHSFPFFSIKRSKSLVKVQVTSWKQTHPRTRVSSQLLRKIYHLTELFFENMMLWWFLALHCVFSYYLMNL